MFIICAILFPIVAGILASVTSARSYRRRCVRYALVSLGSAALGILAILRPERITLFSFSDHVTLSFALDSLGKFFLAAVLILYTLAAFYAMEYMKMEEDRPTFFAFTMSHSAP